VIDRQKINEQGQIIKQGTPLFEKDRSEFIARFKGELKPKSLEASFNCTKCPAQIFVGTMTTEAINGYMEQYVVLSKA